MKNISLNKLLKNSDSISVKGVNINISNICLIFDGSIPKSSICNKTHNKLFY